MLASNGPVIVPVVPTVFTSAAFTPAILWWSDGHHTGVGVLDLYQICVQWVRSFSLFTAEQIIPEIFENG